MSLSERSRAVLYRRLTTIIEDEEAVGEMLTNFPAIEGDQVATKDFVRAEVNALRAELHAEINRMIMWSVGVNAALLALVLTLTGLR
jgi:hypothetical protein